MLQISRFILPGAFIGSNICLISKFLSRSFTVGKMTALTNGSMSKVDKLRTLMRELPGEPIQAYIVPSADAHQSEYIAACDKRRAFISDFKGSAGTAVVTEKEAALFTDGRYFLQAEQQLDPKYWTLKKEGLPKSQTIGSYLNSVLNKGSKVGVDPYLLSPEIWLPIETELKNEGNSLIPVDQNLIDSVWSSEKPKRPENLVVPLPLKYTGKLWREKVKNVREEMQEKQATVLVVTALDEIAWLTNMRGSDIRWNPVFFSYIVLTMDAVHLFIDPEKLDEVSKDHLKDDPVDPLTSIVHHAYDEIGGFLTSIVNNSTGKIWLRRLSDANPIQLMKSVKNPVEVEGMKQSSIRDAVALCEYFSWLESEVTKGNVTEISGADRLEKFRKEQSDFMGISFGTVSGSGPNGAIIHYQPSSETDRPITVDEMYLCDSGGQYRDGTTDVTRTMHFGTPSEYEKECFTRVLKGHINLCKAVFPNLIKGQMVDTLARTSLWNAGLDYLHGTGHGVGAYLNVHEGPIRISQRPSAEDPGLRENMVVSDEPGYYEDGKFGIRIENLVLVVKAETKYNFNNVTYLTFEPLTYVPIQTKLIDLSLMTEAEIIWVNAYHEKCLNLVGKLLKEQGKSSALEWLTRETKPIA